MKQRLQSAMKLKRRVKSQVKKKYLETKPLKFVFKKICNLSNIKASRITKVKNVPEVLNVRMNFYLIDLKINLILNLLFSLKEN